MSILNRCKIFVFSFFQIVKVRNEAVKSFDRKEKEIKLRLANDTSIPKEEIEARYIRELEELRKLTTEETNFKLEELLTKVKQSVS